ncbi:hypothetical protein O181_100141 [Austropuccinia psidii MF-1]|uniref:Uncharacterized protein n=1 Tax=Austropuccinia psidii MF-1 TaxID=1389203 RepID=A0A9Q3JE75_9BASI|nr:hypothetical protein [Austropuccinia psidii MF-1]
MPKAKTRAKQDYLGKRAIQKFELLKQPIHNEESTFRGAVMTEPENQEMNKTTEVFQLVQDRMAIDDGCNGYMIPKEYITEQGCLDKKQKQDAFDKRPANEFVTDVHRYEAIHQNDMNDDATIVPPIDVMVRTKPKIEHHEDNNNPTNHQRKLTQSQRQHIHDSKQIMLQLGNSTSAYKKFSTISIDKKAANASWLKLPSINTLTHPYVIIDKTHYPYLPV